jgi:hypothetical protein
VEDWAFYIVTDETHVSFEENCLLKSFDDYKPFFKNMLKRKGSNADADDEGPFQGPNGSVKKRKLL